jgi:cytochrome c6
MKRALAAAAAVLFLAAGAARAEDASALFASKCASCHGPDGKGKTKMGEKMGVPDLSASKSSAADVEKVVADGKGKMAGYKGKLTDAQIKEVSVYVKTLK